MITPDFNPFFKIPIINDFTNLNNKLNYYILKNVFDYDKSEYLYAFFVGSDDFWIGM